MSRMRLAIILTLAVLGAGCATTSHQAVATGKMCCKKGEQLGLFLDNCLCEYGPCPDEPETVAEAPTKFLVHYRVNHPCLQVSSRAEVDRAIAFLRKNPDHRAVITGHTDGRGERARQEWLSERRAKVVARYMIRKGISADRLEVRGIGDSQPLATNDTETGRAQNRRVEINCSK
jgi:OmpA-OmpF porin, OOP family